MILLRKIALCVLAVALLLIGRQHIGFSKEIRDISTEEAQQMIKNKGSSPDFVVLDVRTPEEYFMGHLQKASMINAISQDFQKQLSQLDKQKVYLVYCQSGGRSGNALKIMDQLGFSTVYNMLGGIGKWKQESRPIEMGVTK